MGKVKVVGPDTEREFVEGLVAASLGDHSVPVRIVPITGSILYIKASPFPLIKHQGIFSKIQSYVALYPTEVIVYYRQNQYEAMLN